MRKKYPFVRQESIYDCGVACLSMVIQYYKGYIPSFELRQLTETTKEGTTAYHLLKGAKEIGFDGKGILCPISELHTVSCPCIAHVIIDDIYPHYIVIYQINESAKTLLIADPNTGIETISYDTFETIYHSILLLLYPIRPLPKQKKNSMIPILKQILKENKWMLLLLLCLSIVGMMLSLVMSFSFSILYQKSNVSGLFILLFLIVIGKNGLEYCKNCMLFHFHRKIDSNLTNDTFSKIVWLPYSIYRRQNSGDLISRLQDLKLIRTLIGEGFIVTSFHILCITMILVCFLLFHLELCLLVIVLTIAIFYCIHHYTKKINQEIVSCQNGDAYLHSYMIEQVTGFEMIKGLSNEKRVTQQFQKRYQQHWSHLLSLQKLFAKETTYESALYDSCYIIFILWACAQIERGIISISEFLPYQILFMNYMSSLQQIVSQNGLWKEAKSAWNRVANIPSFQKGEDEKIEIETLSFLNLTYLYQDRDPVLNNINFTIPKGSKVMIIGNSGSGKSTILKIMKGYYKHSAYHINGISTDALSSYSKEIAYIPQNETLQTGTVFENLWIEEQVHYIEITKLCEVDQIVSQSELQYHMLIEENGFNLSGGEKQRIILARTLLQPCQVLLIDEGLNQMDQNMERRILKRIFEKFPNKTIIIVSHRNENMDLFDQVMKVENGELEHIERSDTFDTSFIS